MNKIVTVCGAMVGLYLIAGCGRVSVTTSAADQQRSRDALVAALDAWKSGQVKALSQQQPPIRFSDDDYVSGLKLIDYELSNPNTPIVPYQDVRVTLALRNQKGEVSKKLVTFQVGVEPNLTVLRSDN